MRVLFVGQYFYPEISAPVDRCLAMVRGFAAEADEVEVLTALPNHPHGVVFPNFRGSYVHTENNGRFLVHRLWVYTRPEKTFLNRILFYGSFMLVSMIFALFNARRFDLVYVSSPPVFTGMIGWLMKKIHPRIRFVFEVCDLWPRTAVELGVLKNPFLIRLAEIVESYLYRSADSLVSATQGIQDELEPQKPGKCDLIYCGVDLGMYSQKTDYAIKEPFTLVYAGNHGLVSGMEVILQAADLLRDQPVRFLLIGDGPIKKNLLDMQARMILPNVEFMDLIPPEQVQPILHAAAVGLSTSARLPINEGRIPVKNFTYMACGLPILASESGEVIRLIERAGCGIGVEPGDPKKLAEAVKWMMAHPTEIAEMGKKGPAFAAREFDYRDYSRQARRVTGRFGRSLET
jgi:colanic acid biosynthesis glycosyl transferase WcaI